MSSAGYGYLDFAILSHHALQIVSTTDFGNSFISILLKRCANGGSTAIVESYSRRVVAAITRIGVRASSAFNKSPPIFVPGPKMVTSICTSSINNTTLIFGLSSTS